MGRISMTNTGRTSRGRRSYLHFILAQINGPACKAGRLDARAYTCVHALSTPGRHREPISRERVPAGQEIASDPPPIVLLSARVGRAPGTSARFHLLLPSPFPLKYSDGIESSFLAFRQARQPLALTATSVAFMLAFILRRIPDGVVLAPLGYKVLRGTFLPASRRLIPSFLSNVAREIWDGPKVSSHPLFFLSFLTKRRNIRRN